MPDVKTEIRGFIIETFLFGQDDGLTDTDSFLERGIVDSTGVLDLVAHLEEAYGVLVKDDEMLPENLDSVEAVAAFVGRKRGGS